MLLRSETNFQVVVLLTRAGVLLFFFSSNEESLSTCPTRAAHGMHQIDFSESEGECNTSAGV